ncbi:MAG: HAD hydrolase-like protein [Campylobacteraceae bacterium]|nr:HAD hydrolase-like protein [Campylobacteraceae bacterium]
MKTNRYKTFIFDCDGVILNSNKIKTAAFYKTALPYGDDIAQLLVDYHINNGGISRYEKFNYMLEKISSKKPTLEELLITYQNEVMNGLLSCDIAKGLTEFRKKSKDIKWIIISGGDEQELRKIFKIRDLSYMFDGGIFGSPNTKDMIVKRELDNKNIIMPAIFFGDSKYDMQVAVRNRFDAVFLYNWTEFKNWQNYCQEQDITCFRDIREFADGFFRC